MIRQVYFDPKIEKNLQLLRRSGKKAALAATRAEEIIARLKIGGVMKDRVGTVTRHGERRIRGVMKYDLGRGYRLVTFKRGNHLFLLYVGTHDDCHRWIENNRELTMAHVQERCTMLLTGEGEDDSGAVPGDDNGEEEDFNPFSSVSEQDLRQVFCGLVSPAARGVEG